MEPHAFYNSIFFADVSRGMRRYIIKAILTTILTAALFFLIFFYVYYFFVLINMQWVYWLIFAALTALFACIRIRAGLKRRDKIIGQFCGMRNEVLIAMEEKYDKASPEYMTLFLLDEYIYFPDEMLLIPYQEIEEAKEYLPYIRYKHLIRINTGTFLKMKCCDGKKYQLRIRDSRRYRDNYSILLSKLDERRKNHRQNVSDLKYSSGNAAARLIADNAPREAVSKLCRAAFRQCTVKAVVSDILILLAAFLLLNSIVSAFGKNVYTAFLTVSLSVNAIVMIVLIFRFSAIREDMLDRTEKFSAEDIETIMQCMVFFGKMFLLDNCLWLIWKNAAFGYDEIEQITSVRHSFNYVRIPDMVQIDIRLKNKKTYSVWIKNDHEYTERYKSFEKSVTEKIRGVPYGK